MCSGVLINVTPQNAGSSDAVCVYDNHADNVTADITATDNVTHSSLPVAVRPKRHSMARAIDSDMRQDSDDVRRLRECLLSTSAFCCLFAFPFSVSVTLLDSVCF